MHDKDAPMESRHASRGLTAEEKEKIRKHQMWMNKEEGGVVANFSDADLSGVYMTGVCLRYADMENANFQDADLTNSDFHRCNFVDANFKGACMEDTNLQLADFENANFENAIMKGCNLRNANLTGARFKNTDLDFSSWPYWCGSIGAIADDRLVAQMVFHLTRLDTSECSPPVKKAIEIIRKTTLANKFCKYRQDVQAI